MLMLVTLVTCAAQPPGERCVFYPEAIVQAARANVERHAWAKASRDRLVQRAASWMAMSDDQLWSLMFGNTIKRSWMVWSNGHCPACKKSVPMYTWEIDALARPWKVRCPHCKELFPKNDFQKFYQSGLDAHGVFDPSRADRSLLFNVEHPAPTDPLHGFGVDDGEGYVDGDRRWRFIGAYLIYGQWKQAILAGIRALADAYTITGDAAYAHKAGVLLDRVADLYPTFDFGREGVMYEGPPMAGYISTWHDACEETRYLALAYDQVRPALATDRELVRFLSAKAAHFHLENPKRSWADIRRNIEERILRDALANRQKIYSNYPRTEIALITILMVLGWPDNRAEVFAVLDPMLQKATAVDGVTGEKGLAGYASYTVQGVAGLLGQLARLDMNLLDDLIRRHPRIRDMFRFHLETWCQYSYYPESGDTGAFAVPARHYVGVGLRSDAGMEPSGFDLLIKLSRLTGDPAFAQIAYLENGRRTEGLPHDLFCQDGSAVEAYVQDIVRHHGAAPALKSVNKPEWCLAILRSGSGGSERDVWLDYDAGGGHGHADALNMGLFAYGLDFLPEMGYPPVQFGGWGSPRATWYKMTAAHNTVVVDGKDQQKASGKYTLWADGSRTHAVRAECPQAAQTERYERTLVLCDAGPEESYVVDVFRVAGGKEHVKFQHSHFGQLTVAPMELTPASDFGHGTQMRNFRMGLVPAWGAYAEWQVEDRYHLLPRGMKAGLRHWELTHPAQVGSCEGWIAVGGYNATEELWIPRLAVRAHDAEMRSCFVSVMEPHVGNPQVSGVQQLHAVRNMGGQGTFWWGDAAVKVSLRGGPQDVIVVGDPAAGAGRVFVPDVNASFEGDLCRISFDGKGSPRYVALVGCRRLELFSSRLELVGKTTTADAFIELEIQGSRVKVLAGREAIETLAVRGRRLLGERRR